ncbi:CocE/NonD family hydrolase [Streptomyces sp. NPDC047000]|uniref:CocE/NonD family hydrolase n=1 Tax=Streptomyces sp. NPDC047000 TaxID=3155474 RepID=UPI0034107FA0
MRTTTVDEPQREAIEQHYGPLGPHSVELTDGIGVTMDDGVELLGTLALPVAAGKVPAVLMRTPYDPASFPPEVAAFHMGEVIAWASHGYACFLQSTRTTTSYFYEAADGLATVRWMERQPWFDGNLGLNGSSYHAFTAWATASSRPAGLKAISTAMYSTDRVSSWYPGGGFGLELALSWTAVQQAGGAAVGEELYDHLPLDQADTAATGTTLDFYQERLAHDGADPHWKPLNFAWLLDDPPAPILHIDGWYDYHRTYFWQDFERLNHNSSDTPHRFVIGPWTHAAPDPRICMAEKLAWFDTHVRGDGTGHFAALSYYRTGADAGWHEIEKWHEPETTVFHAGPDEQLLAASPDPAERVEWTYDPAHPTPSVGFVTLGTGDAGGLWDSGALERRADVRVFTSAVLREPLDLAGHASATTTFFSDAPSADLFLRVLDVHENGQVHSVADGILRVTGPGLGEGVPVKVDLGPVGHRLVAGHRLRLLVAGGAHPYYNRNLGTGEPTATATRTRVARQAVAVGGVDGLRLSLPVAR